MLAVKEGRDDLAKQALMRRQEHVSRGSQMQLTWEAHKQETDRLKESLRGLNDNIEEASRKKNLLLAKQRRAEAQKRISETMSSISGKSGAIDQDVANRADVERYDDRDEQQEEHVGRRAHHPQDQDGEDDCR